MSATPTAATITIRELAQRHSVTLRALRFYEKRGLLNPMKAGDKRFYNENDSMRVAEILRGARLGFTIAEIKDRMCNDATGPWLDITAADAVQQLALMRKQADETAAAIVELQKLAVR